MLRRNAGSFALLDLVSYLSVSLFISACSLSNFPEKDSGGNNDPRVKAEREQLGLGSAAVLNAGTAPGQIVQLDSQGNLPAIDGSQLTGIALLGEVSGPIHSTTVSGALPNAIPNALVRRDSAGGFSAGSITATALSASGAITSQTIAAQTSVTSPLFTGSLTGNATSATTATHSNFGEGRKGNTLTAAATLNFGNPLAANYFEVNGNNAISGLDATSVAGTRVMLHFNGAPLLIHGNSLSLLGGGNFQVAANDVFEFVSQGNGVWREVHREVKNESFLSASAINPLSVDTTPSPVIMSAIQDTQNEYQTGVFTAHQNGIYQVNAQLTLGGSWAIGDSCTLKIRKGALAHGESTGIMAIASTTADCSARVSLSVRLNVGDTLTAVGSVSSGTHNTVVGGTPNQFTYLHIAKIQ